MLSLPFNSSTPVLWVNRDAIERAGCDPDTDSVHLAERRCGAGQLKAGGKNARWSLLGKAGFIWRTYRPIMTCLSPPKTTGLPGWTPS